MNNAKHRYDQAASLVKTHGVLSIVMGAIGAFTGLAFLLIFVVALGVATTDADAVTYLFFFIATLLFWLVPHIYLVIAGVLLVRQPEPRIAKMLTIANLVVGVFWNYVILVVAIISLTQSRDYEEGYK